MRGAEQLPKLCPSFHQNRPGIGKKLSDDPMNTPSLSPHTPVRTTQSDTHPRLTDALAFNDESLYDISPADSLKLTDLWD